MGGEGAELVPRRGTIVVVVGLLFLSCCAALAGVDKDYVLANAAPDAGPDAFRVGRPSIGRRCRGRGRFQHRGQWMPSGRGPTMVRHRLVADAGSYCIDQTEVTNGQYIAFLEAKVDAGPDAGQPAVCSWNGSFVPSDLWPSPQGAGTYPVRHVDWCDAYAFCAWAGKRLCGQMGGGASAPTESAMAQYSQWYATCSGNGVNRVTRTVRSTRCLRAMASMASRSPSAHTTSV